MDANLSEKLFKEIIFDEDNPIFYRTNVMIWNWRLLLQHQPEERLRAMHEEIGEIFESGRQLRPSEALLFVCKARAIEILVLGNN